MVKTFSLLNALILGMWVAGIVVALGIRCLNARRRLNRRGTRELADRLGLTFDEQGARGGVGAFGQLPDGRGVRLYEECRRRRRGLLPWQRGLRLASILEVGVEGEAWEQLNADQRDEARLLMAGRFHQAMDRHRDELTHLGFAQLALTEQAVRLRSRQRLPAPDRMVALLEVMGQIAAEAEAACIGQVLTGKIAVPEQVDLPAQSGLDKPLDRPAAPLTPEEPWRCATCQALNPAELSRCQMCSTRRSAEAKPEYKGEPSAPPPG